MDDAGHLHTLARLSRLIARTGFLDELREAEGSSRALEIVKLHEEVLEAALGPV